MLFYGCLAFMQDHCMDQATTYQLETGGCPSFDVYQPGGHHLLMYINLAVIIRFTFFPMSRVNGSVQPLIYDASTAFPFRVNLIPFVNLFDYDSRRDLLLNVIGNTAMFIPSGIFLPIIYKKLNSFWKVVSAGALFSLCIELIQLPFSVRASDVDDLILNVLGVAIGYGIYSAVKHLNR